VETDIKNIVFQEMHLKIWLTILYRGIAFQYFTVIAYLSTSGGTLGSYAYHKTYI